MAKRTVQVECEYTFSVFTDLEIDEEDNIEDVFVKWDDLRSYEFKCCPFTTHELR